MCIRDRTSPPAAAVASRVVDEGGGLPMLGPWVGTRPEPDAVEAATMAEVVNEGSRSGGRQGGGGGVAPAVTCTFSTRGPEKRVTGKQCVMLLLWSATKSRSLNNEERHGTPGATDGVSPGAFACDSFFHK